MSTHVYTSVVSNYIPKARVLANSLKRFHPEFQFHLVLSDDPPASFRLEEEPFDSLITADQLGLDNLEQWLFMHTLVEVSTGVKGFAMKKLLEFPSCSEVFYFDPDIAILAPLNDLLTSFGKGAVLLTPHLTEPEATTEAILDNEFSVLQHGIYNLGFVGVRNCSEGRRFANWWCNRLRDFCYDDIPHGLFTDQRWADLAPAYFPGTIILREPIYNVATWNLTSRRVEGTPDDLTVNGRRVVFYHFSGFDSGAQQAMLNKYGADMPALYILRDWYIEQCAKMGQDGLGTIRWRYGYFDNGMPITMEHRKLYRERGDLRQAFTNPYFTSDINRSFYHWYEADSSAAQVLNSPRRNGSQRCRIVVSVTGNDTERALRTVHSVVKNSKGGFELLLAGTTRACQAILEDSQLALLYKVVDVAEPPGHGRNFTAALQQCGDSDFLFVQEGIEVPEWWDLRLSWTAQRQFGTATVSPLCAGDPLLGIPVRSDRSTTPTVLDQLAYHTSQFESIEFHNPIRDCVYITHDAAAVARARSGGTCDFAGFLEITQKLRFSHVLADHVCVSRIDTRLGGPESPAPRWISRVHQRIESAQPGDGAVPISAVTRPRQLHVMHSWGGGLERWVREYCRADVAHDNFVVKSIGTWNSFGMELWLYRRIDDPEPIALYPLKPAIKGTAPNNESYRSAMAGIVDRFGIGRILISSLIGHSLDALDMGVPTLMICHDYYPFCPALNITFGDVCRECDPNRLTACTSENPHHRFFLNVPPPEWLNLRESFFERVERSRMRLVAPSPSVRENYRSLAPRLDPAFHVIPHGTRPLPSPPLDLCFGEDRPLRVIVLGSIAPNKGLGLLEQAAPRLLKFARLFLVGCGSHGKQFAEMPGVTVLEEYSWENLPAILRELHPDVALLPSTVPETFSFTLEELNQLAIPTLATGIGSFADRIQDGINGFLCAPEADSIIKRLREIHANRPVLRKIAENLKSRPHRSISSMIQDYEALLPAPGASAVAYFCADSRLRPAAVSGRSQIFWRAEDQPYSEQQSASAMIESSVRRQTMQFPIPAADALPVELRFDPADKSGLLFVHRMTLKDAEGCVVSEWPCNQAMFNEVTHSDIVVLGELTDGAGTLLCFRGDDPRLLLPLADSGKLGQGGMFEVAVTVPSTSDLPLAVADAIRNAEPVSLSAAECESLIASGRAWGRPDSGMAPHPSLELLKFELVAAQTRVAGLENSFSWRISAPLRSVASIILKRFPRAAAK
jgi:glycosyltransferase involved in cell wall biosynthesis